MKKNSLSLLKKISISAIILVGIAFILSLPNTVLASTVKDFGFTDINQVSQEVKDNCSKYIKDGNLDSIDDEVTNDVEFSTCLASAETGLARPPEEGGPEIIIARIIEGLMGIIGAICVFFVVQGGLKYIMAGGNEKTIEEAKKMVLYSVLGLIIAIVAVMVVEVIITIARG